MYRSQFLMGYLLNIEFKLYTLRKISQMDMAYDKYKSNADR